MKNKRETGKATVCGYGLVADGCLVPKAYYRRAISNVALLKYKEALKDFKTVCKKGSIL